MNRAPMADGRRPYRSRYRGPGLPDRTSESPTPPARAPASAPAHPSRAERRLDIDAEEDLFDDVPMSAIPSMAEEMGALVRAQRTIMRFGGNQPHVLFPGALMEDDAFDTLLTQVVGSGRAPANAHALLNGLAGRLVRGEQAYRLLEALPTEPHPLTLTREQALPVLALHCLCGTTWHKKLANLVPEQDADSVVRMFRRLGPTKSFGSLMEPRYVSLRNGTSGRAANRLMSLAQKAPGHRLGPQQVVELLVMTPAADRLAVASLLMHFWDGTGENRIESLWDTEEDRAAVLKLCRRQATDEEHAQLEDPTFRAIVNQACGGREAVSTGILVKAAAGHTLSAVQLSYLLSLVAPGARWACAQQLCLQWNGQGNIGWIQSRMGEQVDSNRVMKLLQHATETDPKELSEPWFVQIRQAVFDSSSRMRPLTESVASRRFGTLQALSLLALIPVEERHRALGMLCPRMAEGASARDLLSAFPDADSRAAAREVIDAWAKLDTSALDAPRAAIRRSELVRRCRASRNPLDVASWPSAVPELPPAEIADLVLVGTSTLQRLCLLTGFAARSEDPLDEYSLASLFPSIESNQAKAILAQDRERKTQG